MNIKYAFLCSIAYSTSSFFVWFHASGLKESVMCMLIVLFFDRYYLYIKKKSFSNLIYASLLLFSLLLFRPAIIFFCLVSIIFSFFLQKRKGRKGFLAVALMFIIFLSLYPVFTSLYDSILKGGDYSQIIKSQEVEGMVKGSVQFTFMVNLLSQLIGPIPTISTDIRPLLSFYSAGLIYKVLLSFFFWNGVFFIFRQKVEELYVLIFFTIFEMSSLLLILEGLELRKSLPHFFVIYIVSFWFMEKCQSKQILTSFKALNKIKLSFYFFSIFSFSIILIWNLRYSIL